jgi:hypothetical protein
VLAAADGTAGNGVKPTQAQYEALGISGISTPQKASLLGQVIDAKPSTAVDSVSDIQDLADAVTAIMAAAAGGSGPSLAQLQDLGVTGVTPANLAEVQKAIQGTADDGSGADSLAELQALFAAASVEDFEDSEDTGVLPADEVKSLKAALKDAKGMAKTAKRDPALGDWQAFALDANRIEAQLMRHKALEDEAKTLKAHIKTTTDKKERRANANITTTTKRTANANVARGKGGSAIDPLAKDSGKCRNPSRPQRLSLFPNAFHPPRPSSSPPSSVFILSC